jgi:hypothetical protein
VITRGNDIAEVRSSKENLDASLYSPVHCFVRDVCAECNHSPVDQCQRQEHHDRQNDQKTAIACTDNAVTVSSEDNNITLSGECRKLTVKGKDNNVTASSIQEVVVSGTDVNVIVANVGRINVTGNDVNVVWANGIGGKPPKISQKKGNDINIVHNGK